MNYLKFSFSCCHVQGFYLCPEYPGTFIFIRQGAIFPITIVNGTMLEVSWILFYPILKKRGQTPPDLYLAHAHFMCFHFVNSDNTVAMSGLPISDNS